MSSKNRREYGTGGVWQRKSDSRWIGTLEAGWTAKGTRRRITVSGKTEAEARRKLGKKRDEIAREGVPAADTSSRATVKAWAPVWLDHVVHELRPKAYATYRSNVNKWIVPTIGHKRLSALTPGDLRSVTNAARDAGRAQSTIRHLHIVLTKMLRAAVVEGHRVPQRVLLLDVPAKGISDRDAIPLPHTLDLLQAASALPDGSRWAAAFLQGMRKSECLGLTWPLVDLEAGTIDVSWQLQALPYRRLREVDSGFRVPDGYEARQLTGAKHLVRPKTQSGQRIIPLVPWMVDALHAWQQVAPGSRFGLVWPDDDGGPRDQDEDTAAWKALQDAAQVAHVDGEHGRRYAGHEARHSCATLLLELGVDTEVIKTILGHSSIVTSRGYQHASVQLARQALEQLATRLDLKAGTADAIES